MQTTTKNLKALLVKYEAVRQSGNYNMLTEAPAAREEAGLTQEEYYYVMDNYESLRTLKEEKCEGLAALEGLAEMVTTMREVEVSDIDYDGLYNALIQAYEKTHEDDPMNYPLLDLIDIVKTRA